MAVILGGAVLRQKDDVLGVKDIHVSALRQLGGWVMACGVLALAVLYDPARPVSWLPSLALMAFGYLIYRLAPARPSLAAFLLIGALWVILSAAVVLYPGVPLTPLFSLLTLPAAFLFAPWLAVAVALGSAGLILALIATSPGTESFEVYALALFMIFSLLIFSWLLAEPLKAALRWAWVAYDQAQEKMNEAREQRAELGRTTKSLNETLTQLEDLNRQIAEARAIAVEARRLKSEFAAAISHELRTPLNLIIGYAEMLIQPRRLPAMAQLSGLSQKHLQAIYRNACHISHLIDDILDLSQIDAHRLALHKEVIALAVIIEEAAAVVRDLFEDEGLQLTIDVPDDLPGVLADATRIRQILINLLGNASRFTDEGGVTIRASRGDNQIVVAVTDTGMGIPSRDLPYVFEEFRQFGERKHGGSGLGLSICKRLIDLHGGNMWVESTPGHGSTFSFSLPTTETVALGGESLSLRRNLAVIARQQIQPTLALVNGDSLSKVIERYLDNYRIEKVESVDRARWMLASGRASGVVFCREEDNAIWRAMQREEPSLHPVAYCPLRSANRVPDELGAADYLVKPISQAQLGASFRRVAKRCRTIGIVEDHPEMSDLLEEMVRALRPTGTIWKATNGRDALTLLRAECPDVLLLDLLMPHLNGYELLHEMRRDERLRKVATIVITGAEDHNEHIMADMVGITRRGGMTVGEAMACLKRGLDSLRITPEEND